MEGQASGVNKGNNNNNNNFLRANEKQQNAEISRQEEKVDKSKNMVFDSSMLGSVMKSIGLKVDKRAELDAVEMKDVHIRMEAALEKMTKTEQDGFTALRDRASDIKRDGNNPTSQIADMHYRDALYAAERFVFLKGRLDASEFEELNNLLVDDSPSIVAVNEELDRLERVNTEVKMEEVEFSSTDVSTSKVSEFMRKHGLKMLGVFALIGLFVGMAALTYHLKASAHHAAGGPKHPVKPPHKPPVKPPVHPHKPPVKPPVHPHKPPVHPKGPGNGNGFGDHPNKGGGGHWGFGNGPSNG